MVSRGARARLQLWVKAQRRLRAQNKAWVMCPYGAGGRGRAPQKHSGSGGLLSEARQESLQLRLDLSASEWDEEDDWCRGDVGLCVGAEVRVTVDFCFSFHSLSAPALCRSHRSELGFLASETREDFTDTCQLSIILKKSNKSTILSRYRILGLI